jgi:hypothetical protein
MRGPQHPSPGSSLGFKRAAMEEQDRHKNRREEEEGRQECLSLLRSEFVGGGGEDFGVGVDVGFGGGG